MQALLRRYGAVLTSLFMGLTVFWIAAMVILPEIRMVDFSFRPNLPLQEQGGATDRYTIANYRTLFQNQIHLWIFFKTIWASALVTLVTLIICYPIAYHLAQGVRKQNAARLILLLTIPFWINELLRTFAWWIILAFNGPLNQILLALGVIGAPVRYLSGDVGVVIGLTYAYVLFMIFPLYSALESLDRNQIEAARDLGASIWRIHARVVVPHAKPGIATGCIMTFMLSAGSYAVPSLLGSPGSRWFTEIIYNWFFEGGNWNQGAAYAFILLLLCILFIMAMLRIFRVSLGEITR
jgi:spermidine/putrescine transport system permease protein